MKYLDLKIAKYLLVVDNIKTFLYYIQETIFEEHEIPQIMLMHEFSF